MNEDTILNQIASLRRLDEAVLRHLVLDMAVSAFSSPDGLAHQTMNLAKLAYNGMGAPAQNGAAAQAALPAPARGRPAKKLMNALTDVLTDEGVGEQIDHDTRAEFLTRAQVAKRRGISMATVSRMVQQGRLHSVKLPGGRIGRGGPLVGIRAADVDALEIAGRPKRDRHVTKEGDLTAPEWRVEIVDYARQHEGVFNMDDFRKVYSLKYPKNVPLGQSRCRMVLYDMAARLKLTTNIGKGIYRLTAKGRSFKGDSPDFSAPAARKSRNMPGAFREWILAYAKRHRGVVIVKELKATYKEEHGGQITGGKIYDYLNDPKLFNKQGEGRFVLTGVAGSSVKASTQGTLLGKRNTSGVVRRVALTGLHEDIFAFAVQHGGEVVMKDYTLHFNEKFPNAGGAASRTGSIYGAVSQLIQKRKLEKVGIGVYRLTNPRQEANEEPAAGEESAAAAAIYE